MAENADSCALFCPVQKFCRQRGSKHEPTDKGKLVRVDNENDPRGVGEVDIQTKLAQEISPPLVPEQIHL